MAQLVRFLDILFCGTTISFKNGTLYQQDFMSSKEALVFVSPNIFIYHNNHLTSSS